MMEIDNLKQHNLNSKNPFPDGGAVRGFVLLTHYWSHFCFCKNIWRQNLKRQPFFSRHCLISQLLDGIHVAAWLKL